MSLNVCVIPFIFLPYEVYKVRTFIIIFVDIIYWEVTFNICLKYTILPPVSLSRVFRR